MCGDTTWQALNKDPDNLSKYSLVIYNKLSFFNNSHKLPQNMIVQNKF